MPPWSIAAAELRTARSRRELAGAVRRLGQSLARPSSLAAVAAAGALAGFALARGGGVGALARGLARAMIKKLAAR